MRDSYHHGDLRQALVDEALTVVRVSGERGFSLRAAARAVGVDVAAAYRHFANKEALLVEVAAWAFAELARRMERGIAEADDVEARFLATGRAYVQFAVDEAPLFRMAFGPRGSGGAVSARGTGESGRDPYQLLLDSLEALHAAGRIEAPAGQAAISAWAAVHGLAYLIVDGNLDPKVAPDALEQVLATVLRGLRG